MKKPFAVLHLPTRTFIEYFEYPEQALKYIWKRYNDSKAYIIIDLRKRR